jgi:phosphoglycolate phosphatase
LTALSPWAGAVVFDLDGVIVDSRRAVRGAVNAALAENGLAVRPGEQLDRFIGPPVRWAFASLTGEDEDSAFVAACVDAYHRRYAAVYLEQTELVAGIDDVLASLSVPLAVATAKVADFVGPLLDVLGIAGRLSVVAAPTIEAPDEPKTAIVARALAGLGSAAAHAVMIGDRSFDVAAARANGIRSVGVLWGIGDRAELEGAGADVIVERMEDLVGVLEASWSAAS